MKRSWRWVLGSKPKSPVSKHSKHTLWSKDPLIVNYSPTFSRKYANTNITSSNGAFCSTIPPNSIKKSTRRYLTGSNSDRAEPSTILQAATDKLMRKIPLLFQQEGVSINSTNGSEINTKDIVTSQETFRLVERWAQLALKSPKRKNAALRCQQVVELLEDHCRDTPLEPNRHYYDLLLQALCATGQQQSAHEILLKISREAVQGKRIRSSTKISAKSFHIVMNGWTSSIRATKTNSDNRYQMEVLEKVQELYRILESLQPLADKRDQALQPNERTLTALLAAWAQSGHSDARNEIVQLLQRAAEQGHPVDLALFHTLLQSLTKATAFNKSRPSNRESSRRTAELCEQLLQLATSQFHLNPTTQTYSLVIHAWAQCEVAGRNGEAAERAEKLLRLMMRSYSTDGASVKPNTLTFTTCMAAWSRCDQPEKAQGLLEELLELYQQTKDPDFKPDTASGNVVVTAWSRSDSPVALEKTKGALAKLQTFASADLISYNALLHAYSRRGMYREALSLVEELEVKGAKQGNSRLLPDVVSYNCALHALVRSKIEGSRNGKEPGIDIEARKLVEKMKALALNRDTVNPTHSTYTLLLKAYTKEGNSTSINCDILPQGMPLSKIRQVLEEVLGNSPSVPSPQYMTKKKKTTRVDAMFCVALLQACSTQYQIRKAHKDASKLAFEIMVEILKADSSGRQSESNTTPLPSTLIANFPAFRIYDDWLFVVMLETCDRLLATGADVSVEAESNPGVSSVISDLGTSSPWVASDSVTLTTPSTTTMTPDSNSVPLDEWMVLINSIVNRVQVEGYLSRRVIARLQALSKTLARSQHDPSGGRARTVGGWLFSDASGANDSSMLLHPLGCDVRNTKHLKREWSRRIPSRHRP